MCINVTGNSFLCITSVLCNFLSGIFCVCGETLHYNHWPWNGTASYNTSPVDLHHIKICNATVTKKTWDTYSLEAILTWAKVLTQIFSQTDLRYVGILTESAAHHNNNVAHVFSIFRVEEVHELFFAQPAILVFVCLFPPSAVSVDHVSISLCSGPFLIWIWSAEVQIQDVVKYLQCNIC